MYRHWLAVTILTVCAIFVGLRSTAVGVEAAPDAAAAPTTSKMSTVEKSDTKGAAGGRLREGSKLVDLIGEFQKSGDRISFVCTKDGPVGLRVLENLALERVARVLDDNPSLRVWSISGVITEYRGENYLLLTRALLKARTDASVPTKAPAAPTKGEL